MGALSPLPSHTPCVLGHMCWTVYGNIYTHFVFSCPSLFFTRDCSKVLVWQFCFSVRSFRLFFFFFSNFYSSFVSAASASSSFSLLPCVSQYVCVCVGDFCFCLLVLCFVSSVSARHQRQFYQQQFPQFVPSFLPLSVPPSVAIRAALYVVPFSSPLAVVVFISCGVVNLFRATVIYFLNN